MGQHTSNEHKAYWKANLRLLAALLAVWVFVSFGLSIFLAEPLNAIRIGGYRLGFFFAQQGSIYVFIALIFIYVWRMNRLDKKYRLND